MVVEQGRRGRGNEYVFDMDDVMCVYIYWMEGTGGGGGGVSMIDCEEDERPVYNSATIKRERTSFREARAKHQPKSRFSNITQNNVGREVVCTYKPAKQEGGGAAGSNGEEEKQEGRLFCLSCSHAFLVVLSFLLSCFPCRLSFGPDDTHF